MLLAVTKLYHRTELVIHHDLKVGVAVGVNACNIPHMYLYIPTPPLPVPSPLPFPPLQIENIICSQQRVFV